MTAEKNIFEYFQSLSWILKTKQEDLFALHYFVSLLLLINKFITILFIDNNKLLWSLS